MRLKANFMRKKVNTLILIIGLFSLPLFAFAASISPTSGATPDEAISTSAGDEFWQMFPPDHSVMIFYSRGTTNFNFYQNTCTGGTFCNNPNSQPSYNQAGTYPVFHETNQASSCFAAYPNMTYACLSTDPGVDQFGYTATSPVGGGAVSSIAGLVLAWWGF